MRLFLKVSQLLLSFIEVVEPIDAFRYSLDLDSCGILIKAVTGLNIASSVFFY